MAGVVNVGEVMNSVRLKSMEDGLRGQEKKIYDCIPITGAISLPQLVGEMKDRHGARIDMNVAKACVGQLMDKKLVRSVDDRFVRATQRPVLVAGVGTEAAGRTALDSVASSPVTVADEPPHAATSNPIERMAVIESALKDIANSLVVLSKEVADVAVDAELFVEKIKNDNAKVAQLKELLKSL